LVEGGPPAAQLQTWCPRTDSNRHAMIARDFKSLVSTYSTTRAMSAQPRANLLQVPEPDSRYSEVPTWTVLLTACLIAIGILAIVVGLPQRTRTSNLRLRRPLLYPVELGGVSWWALRDSNSEPTDYESGALTN
jgi:hypothetical protein